MLLMYVFVLLSDLSVFMDNAMWILVIEML